LCQPSRDNAAVIVGRIRSLLRQAAQFAEARKQARRTHVTCLAVHRDGIGSHPTGRADIANPIFSADMPVEAPRISSGTKSGRFRLNGTTMNFLTMTLGDRKTFI
jgi:hypothetical protein